MPAGTLTAGRALPRWAGVDLHAVGVGTVVAALVSYLALKGGGYDVVVSSEAGIALWWIAALGVASGALAQWRASTPALVFLALIAAYAAWSLLSATWSDSGERAVAGAARNITILGALVLAACAVRERDARPVVGGVLVAIVTVAGVATLSRLHPAWFGTPETETALGLTKRLSFGLNYWNAVGAFAAIGAPLALGVAMSARHAVVRAAAIGVMPILALTILLTVSRGAIATAAIALLVAGSLTDGKLRWLGKLALAGVGSALVVAAALQRDGVIDGADTPLARSQGDELIAVAIVVCAGVALLHLGVSYLRDADVVRLPTAPRLPRALVPGLLVALVAGALVAGAGSEASDRWRDFKQPHIEVDRVDGVGRLGSFSGTGRYQFWSEAGDAWQSKPLAGRGEGSYEDWWAAHNTTIGQSIRDAHSLYLQALAELGIVGFALIAGAVLLVLAGGVRRVSRAGAGERALLAGALGACAGFAAIAGVDWMWQITVMPVVFVVLAVVLLGPGRGAPAPPRALLRGGVGVAAVLAVVALLPALAATTKLRESQAAASERQFDRALERAAGAVRSQPYAISPELQRALVLEARGDLDGAAKAASLAERRQPTSWRAPYTRARIEAERGNAAAAVAAYRRAKRLNRIPGFLP